MDPDPAPAAPPRHTFAALAAADYRRLWLGVLCMMGGMQMQGIVRGFLTYELTSSPVKLGMVNAGFAVPMLLLSLLGGVAADRMDCKRIIQISQAVGASTALFLAFAVASGRATWVHLLAVSVVDGVIFSFSVPARNALIPRLVGPDLVTNALALNTAALSTTTLLAPAAAGVLYAWIGPAGVYGIIAALGVLAVLVTGRIGARDAQPAAPGQTVAGEIAAGLSYIGRSPVLVELLLVGLFTALLEFPFRAMLPVLVVDVYARQADSLGLLMSIMGAGAVIGSLVVASLRPGRRGMVLICGAASSGAAMGMIALVPVYGLAAALMVPLGIGDAIRRSLNMALVVEAASSSYRGRVTSVYAMNFGLMPLGVLPAGVAAEALGIRATTGILGLLLLSVAAAMLLGRRQTRRLA
jgi:MFS family permease